MVKILNSTYAKADLKKVENSATEMNAEEITLLLSLLGEFGDLFDITLGNWATEPVYLEIKQISNY